MAASVRANPIAQSLLDGAEHELGFRMDAPRGAFQVQCRADILHRWSHIADLKTTADVDDFAHSVSTYGYHRQAALYRWIISHACDGELLPFSFIVVEKAPPLYRCRVIDLDKDYLAIGSIPVRSCVDGNRPPHLAIWRLGGSPRRGWCRRRGGSPNVLRLVAAE